MQSESGKEPRYTRHGDTCAVRLLAASSPAEVIATIAARLPVAMEAAFWSPAWPEAIASHPADARDLMRHDRDLQRDGSGCSCPLAYSSSIKNRSRLVLGPGVHPAPCRAASPRCA